ncbi:hypothetical protein Q604_UNBC06988G0001, partial [human gut metagenome]
SPGECLADGLRSRHRGLRGAHARILQCEGSVSPARVPGISAGGETVVQLSAMGPGDFRLCCDGALDVVELGRSERQYFALTTSSLEFCRAEPLFLVLCTTMTGRA